MTIRFDGRVVLITGAGGGLGRAHALEFARRGAKVVVNDPGGDLSGTGTSSQAAQDVVAEITEMGGEAMANGASVTDQDAVGHMIEEIMSAYGRIDILVNNAGILRDKSFGKMTLEDFDLVLDVHLRGAAYVTHAVWPIMKAQKYGRIVMTASSTGLYGNFGQTNYGAAKLGQVGFMNSLKLEGAKDNIRINTIVPIAATRMTISLFPKQMLDLFRPELVSPAVMLLAGEDAPNGEIICAAAGHFSKAHMVETDGVSLGPDVTAEMLAKNWDSIVDTNNQQPFEMGARQTEKFAMKAMTTVNKG